MTKSVYMYLSFIIISSYIYGVEKAALMTATCASTTSFIPDAQRPIYEDGAYNLLGSAHLHLLAKDNQPIEDGENPGDRRPFYTFRAGDVIRTKQHTALPTSYITSYTLEGKNVITVPDTAHPGYNKHVLSPGITTVVCTTTNITQRADNSTTVRKEVTKHSIVIY